MDPMMATQVSRRCFCKTVSPPFHSGFNVFHDAEVSVLGLLYFVYVLVCERTFVYGLTPYSAASFSS